MTATRGKAGGYAWPARQPRSAWSTPCAPWTGPILEMPCAGSDNLEACARPQDCSVHDVFQRVHDSLEGALSGTNLAEVAMAAGGPPFPMAVAASAWPSTPPRRQRGPLHRPHHQPTQPAT